MHPTPFPSRALHFQEACLNTLVLTLGLHEPPKIADELHKMFGGRPDAFAGESLVLDFSGLPEWPDRIDWAGLFSLFRRYRLQPVAVVGLPEGYESFVRQTGLALIKTGDLCTDARSFATAFQTPASPERPAMDPLSAQNPVVTSSPTLVIERQVRSGQQIYARGGDLVLLAGMSDGAEVIADGSIHCYGPLRGRALAGAQGQLDARILTTHFSANLVAVAGVYRTFDVELPAALDSHPVQVRLSGTPQENLIIEPLNLN
jgi:septum site-determining protein MinC